jgi:hypothetical protein
VCFVCLRVELGDFGQHVSAIVCGVLLLERAVNIVVDAGGD